jgi:hypothetical protein
VQTRVPVERSLSLVAGIAAKGQWEMLALAVNAPASRHWGGVGLVGYTRGIQHVGPYLVGGMRGAAAT